VSQTDIHKTKALHKLGQLHPKTAIIHSTALNLLAFLAAVNDTGPLRACVGPLAIPFALTVRIAYAHKLHTIAGQLRHLTSIDNAVGVVG
jgi:hypothetical protein